MLLNLTNHPSANWSEAQIRAAKARWGSVSDLPFPAVDSMTTTAQVAELARRSVEQACALRPEAVLCQGEIPLHLLNVLTLGTPFHIPTKNQLIVPPISPISCIPSSSTPKKLPSFAQFTTLF